MTSELQVRIDALAFGGAGVGRFPSGKVVLVEGGAPGDLVEVRTVTEKRSLVLATVGAVIEAAPCRVAPACSLAGRCGGCSWMHIGISAQRAWKRRLLEGELERAGLLTEGAQLAELIGGAPLGGRIRSRLHRRGARLGTLARRSHDVVPLSDCPILAPELRELGLSLARAVADLPASDAEVEICIDARGRRGLAVQLDSPRHASTWRALAADLGVASIHIDDENGAPIHDSGPPLQEDSAGVPLDLAPGLFAQADREMNAHLVAAVSSAVDPRTAKDFVELYAGVGNFTVHLARMMQRGVACESVLRAIPLLRRNVAVPGCEIEVRAETDRRSAYVLARRPAVDLLLADPPRAGIKAVWPLFEAAPPRRVVLVSCHPMAAVRDLKHLCRTARYRLERVVPIDMFPQTHHLELVAVLSR